MRWSRDLLWGTATATCCAVFDDNDDADDDELVPMAMAAVAMVGDNPVIFVGGEGTVSETRVVPSPNSSTRKTAPKRRHPMTKKNRKIGE
jgi:hypothetical protein